MLASSLHVQTHIPSMQNAPLPPQPGPSHQQQPQQHNPHPNHAPQQPLPHRFRHPKEPVRFLAVPSIAVQGDQVIYGDADSRSERSYTHIKDIGDGSFGTVSLVDWHSTLPPNTPLSPMQRGGTKPEWNGKRLVALKRMKRRWEGGWDECRKLKELESLRAIPFHPNIIPLYDFFLLPSTKELYFVFESMEGNLYQLIKVRKGRPLVGGLVSCIFRQVVAGLHHIHNHGYFHRDMKPENLLVTTTGLFDYRNVSPVAAPNAPPERDVVVIVKLADFGLARETKSKPPYTEYVSTRWYRAPEVLLRSRDYSNPVDMWALGTIMAELINLRPLFPGTDELDQVARICGVLGDPSDEYGVDARGSAVGGGKWTRGIKMAKALGFTFPKLRPVPIQSHFDRNVPRSIIECISDLLKYDPEARLTSQQCLEHPYILETAPGNCPPGLPPTLGVVTASANGTPTRSGGWPPASSAASVQSISPRTVPPSHSQSPAGVRPAFNGAVPPVPPIPAYAQVHRVPFYSHAGEVPNITYSAGAARADTNHNAVAGASHSMDAIPTTHTNGTESVVNGWTTNNMPSDDVAMDVSSPHATSQPHIHTSNSPGVHPMDITISSSAVHDEHAQQAALQNHGLQQALPAANGHIAASGSKPRFLGFGKKHSKWGLGGMFGHGDKGQQNVLAPVDELNVASSISTPSLKRTQSSSTGDSRSLSELSPVAEQSEVSLPPMDAKSMRKKAELVELEAEKARRAQAQKRIREQSRAVMQKREQLTKLNKPGAEVDWESSNSASLLGLHKPKSKQRSGAPAGSSSATINAAGGRFRGANDNFMAVEYDNWREAEHRTKARRREFDDDHSMSSSDVQSVGRLSVISFATVESDPSSSRLRYRPSMFGINRMQSASSLRTSFGDDFPASARSSHSPSLEQQLANDFDSRASFSSYDPVRSSFSDCSSPPPMQMLSLGSQPRPTRQTFITLPPVNSMQPPNMVGSSTPSSPYEYGQYGQIQAQPPSPAIAPHSAINPIFKVPPLSSQLPDGNAPSPHNSLPPFSQLASVAEQYPPQSPMS